MQDNSDYKNSVIIMIIEKAAAAAFLFTLASLSPPRSLAQSSKYNDKKIKHNPKSRNFPYET